MERNADNEAFTMNHLPTEQHGNRDVQPSTARGDQMPARTTRALGAVAVGAFALGATAIGALAIGSLAIGAFAMKRGRVRRLVVDHLDVRRLHVGTLIVERGLPR